MKILTIASLILPFFLYAQTPQFESKGEGAKSVSMAEMKISIKVMGNIAYTDVEMIFRNKSSRDMEGELIFPLPEGTSVSRYAIDINGRMREAVPINKNKGKQVFEAIEHRNIDPGLLEKTVGNNFKTRIYPIPANGYRRVIIGYEQELTKYNEQNFQYLFQTHFPNKLDELEVNIAVVGSVEKPQIENGSQNLIQFEKLENQYVSHVLKKDFLLNEKLTIRIPTINLSAQTISQNAKDGTYFYSLINVKSETIKKEKPKSVGIIWDNSLSSNKRDRAKEIEFLKKYLQNIKGAKASLFSLNYYFLKELELEINDENIEKIISKIKLMINDGGTRYSEIRFEDLDEYLFFTDGISTLSDRKLPKTTTLIYPISSSLSSDFSYLNYISKVSKGNFINLSKLNVDEGFNLIQNQSLRFLGIEQNINVSEIYPATGANVGQSISISGKSKKSNTNIMALFGYGNKVTMKRLIKLDTNSQACSDIRLDRIWAQKKIEDLSMLYEKNSAEIEELGKKYNIVTDNTSLIVLESLDDYIRYEIAPPLELKAKYDSVLRSDKLQKIAQKKNNWTSIATYHADLEKWWSKNYKYIHVRSQRKKEEDVIHRVNSQTSSSSEIEVAEEIIESKFAISDSAAAPPPSPPTASSTIQFVPPKIVDLAGVSQGATQNNLTRLSFSIDKRAKRDELARKLAERRSNLNGFANLNSNSYNWNTDTVQNGAYESKSYRVDDCIKEITRRLLDSVAAISESDMNSNAIEEIGVDSVAEAVVEAAETAVEAVESYSDTTEEPNFYLDSIQKLPSNFQYGFYCRYKDSNLDNPSFFYDIATYFYSQKQFGIAYLVLSSIADLGLENHQLYKSLNYIFRTWGARNEAEFVASQVLKWREFEPQSYRDYGLSLEENGKPQLGFDYLVKALETNYYEEMSGQYEGIEDIILMDINRLIQSYPSLNTSKLDKRYLLKLPIDLRVVFNWNMPDIDLDLHILEPTGEDCYYSNTSSRIGGRFSKDFTQGYGPEQYLLKRAIRGSYAINCDYYGDRDLREDGPPMALVEVFDVRNGKISKSLKFIELSKSRKSATMMNVKF